MATPPTFANNTVVTAADLAFALDPPRGFVSAAAGSFADTVKSAITFTALGWDTDSMWSAGTPTRLTTQTPGLYSLTITVTMASAVYGLLNINPRANSGGAAGGGTTIYNYAPINATVTGTTNGAVTANFTMERQFNAGDYVEVFVEQKSGATRSLTLAYLQMRWLAYLS